MASGWRPGAPERDTLSFPFEQARGKLALKVFGISVGLPAALGLAPVSVLALSGALGATAVGTYLVTGAGREALRRSVCFLGLATTAMTAATLRFGTTDLDAAHAAQAILGPGPLLGPTLAAGLSAGALALGWISGGFWLKSLPELPGFGGRLLRWGETALVGAAVTACAWGPSAALFARGTISIDTATRGGVSFLVTIAGVALLGLTRRIFSRASDRIALMVLIPATMALVAGVIGFQAGVLPP